MAKQDQFKQEEGNEYEKTELSENSLHGPRPKKLTRRKTGGEIAPVDNPKKRTSVRKKASYATKANATALKASKPDKSNADSIIVNSMPGQAGEKTSDNNGIMRNGNPAKKNTFSIVALSLSGFLVIFVLLFCIIPLKKISYEVPIVYQDIEFYTEQEPYLETVYYWEKEPYTITESYTVSEPYTVIEPYILYYQRPMSSPRPVPHSHTDNSTSPNPPPLPPPPPQPTVHYREVTNLREVTKYRDVVQYKDVQKSRAELRFRPVQKQKTVTKVRQETRYRMVPILYYEMV